LARKRQKTFATETKQAKQANDDVITQANDDVITQVHRMQSQNVWYGMQMQLQCMQMHANATAKSCIGYNNSTGTLYP
jgi:hypothetical protein